MKNRLLTSALCAALVAGAGVVSAQPTFTLLQTIDVGSVGIGPTDIVYYEGDAYVTVFGSLSGSPVATGGSPTSILRINDVLTATPSTSLFLNPCQVYGPGTGSDTVGGPAKHTGPTAFFGGTRGLSSIELGPNGRLLVTGDNGGGAATPPAGGALREYDHFGYITAVYDVTPASPRRLSCGVYFGPGILASTIFSDLIDTDLAMDVLDSVQNYGNNFTRGIALFQENPTSNYIFLRRTSSGNDSIRVIGPGTTLGDRSTYPGTSTEFFNFGAGSFRVDAGITTWTYGGETYVVAARSPATSDISFFDVTPFPGTLPVAAPTFTLTAPGGGTHVGATFVTVGSSTYALVGRTAGTPANAIDVFGVDGAVLQPSAPPPPNVLPTLDYALPTISEEWTNAELVTAMGAIDFGSGGNPDQGVAIDVDTEGNLYIWNEATDTLHRLRIDGVTVDALVDGATLAAVAGLANANVTAIEWTRNAIFTVVRDGANSAVLRIPLANANGTADVANIQNRYADVNLVDVKANRYGTELFITQRDSTSGNIYRIPLTSPSNPEAAPAPFLMSNATWVSQTGAAQFSPSEIQVDPEGVNDTDVYVYDSGLRNLIRIDVPTTGEGTAVTYVSNANLVTGGPTTPSSTGVTAISSDIRGGQYLWDFNPAPNTNLADRALIVVEPNGTTVRRFQMTNTAGPATYFSTALGEPSATQYRTRTGGMATISRVNSVDLYVLDEVANRILKITIPEFTAPPIANGDANGDSFIDVADVTAIYNFLAGITGAPAGDADIDNDSDIDTNDVTLLINFLVNGTPLP